MAARVSPDGMQGRRVGSTAADCAGMTALRREIAVSLFPPVSDNQTAESSRYWLTLAKRGTEIPSFFACKQKIAPGGRCLNVARRRDMPHHRCGVGWPTAKAALGGLLPDLVHEVKDALG